MINKNQEKYHFLNLCDLCRYAQVFAGPVTYIVSIPLEQVISMTIIATC